MSDEVTNTKDNAGLEEKPEETTVKAMNESLAPVMVLFEPIKKETKHLLPCKNHYQNENLICMRLHSKNIPSINYQYVKLVNHPDIHLEFQVCFQLLRYFLS